MRRRDVARRIDQELAAGRSRLEAALDLDAQMPRQAFEALLASRPEPRAVRYHRAHLRLLAGLWAVLCGGGALTLFVVHAPVFVAALVAAVAAVALGSSGGLLRGRRWALWVAMWSAPFTACLTFFGAFALDATSFAIVGASAALAFAVFEGSRGLLRELYPPLRLAPPPLY